MGFADCPAKFCTQKTKNHCCHLFLKRTQWISIFRVFCFSTAFCGRFYIPCRWSVWLQCQGACCQRLKSKNKFSSNWRSVHIDSLTASALDNLAKFRTSCRCSTIPAPFAWTIKHLISLPPPHAFSWLLSLFATLRTDPDRRPLPLRLHSGFARQSVYSKRSHLCQWGAQRMSRASRFCCQAAASCLS